MSVRIASASYEDARQLSNDLLALKGEDSFGISTDTGGQNLVFVVSDELAKRYNDFQASKSQNEGVKNESDGVEEKPAKRSKSGK